MHSPPSAPKAPPQTLPQQETPSRTPNADLPRLDHTAPPPPQEEAPSRAPPLSPKDDPLEESQPSLPKLPPSSPNPPSLLQEETGTLPFQTSAEVPSRLLWLSAVAILFALLAAALFVFFGYSPGPQPPFLSSASVGTGTKPAPTGIGSPGPQPPFLSSAPPGSVSSQRPQRGLLHIAGSGSNLALTRLLLGAFLRQHPDKDGQIHLHPSIGSTGGIRATREGAIQLGLISRPLSRAEQALPLRTVPYARVAVVFAAHPSVPFTGLSFAQIRDLYAGKKIPCPSPCSVVVLQREQGDSSHLVVNRRLPGFAAINREAYRSRRWRILYRDRAMEEALLHTPGAIGLFDLGAIVSQRLPLKVLAVEGISPTPGNVRLGRYPFFKDLAFVLPPSAPPLAWRFIRFTHSTTGRRIIRHNGYIPLSPTLSSTCPASPASPASPATRPASPATRPASPSSRRRSLAPPRRRRRTRP